MSRLSNSVDENQIRLQRWHALGELARTDKKRQEPTIFSLWHK